jgi:integrase
MATYFKRKNRDGSRSILTIVRVKGFKPTSKSFKVETTQAEARERASAWAEPLEKNLKDQAKRGGVREDVATLTLRRLIDEFLLDPKTRALKSIADLEERLGWWSAQPDLATTKIADLGPVQLRHARAKLMAGGRKNAGRGPATVNRHLSALRSCWNWGRAAGLIPQERAWPTKLLLQEPGERTRFLSPDELSGLLKAAEADTVVRAAILVSVATGIRRGELLRMRWKDLDLDAGKLTMTVTKNKAPRTVYVPPSAVEALRALRQAKVVSPVYVFVNASGEQLGKSHLNNRWRRIRTAAGLKDFRWHDLRHSCASFLAREGASLLEIGSVLGHKSSTMTKRYAHLVQGAPVRGHAELDALLRGK